MVAPADRPERRLHSRRPVVYFHVHVRHPLASQLHTPTSSPLRCETQKTRTRSPASRGASPTREFTRVRLRPVPQTASARPPLAGDQRRRPCMPLNADCPRCRSRTRGSAPPGRGSALTRPRIPPVHQRHRRSPCRGAPARPSLVQADIPDQSQWFEATAHRVHRSRGEVVTLRYPCQSHITWARRFHGRHRNPRARLERSVVHTSPPQHHRDQHRAPVAPHISRAPTQRRTDRKPT